MVSRLFCDGPCVTYSGTVPACVLSVARFLFGLRVVGVPRGGNFGPN